MKLRTLILFGAFALIPALALAGNFATDDVLTATFTPPDTQLKLFVVDLFSFLLSTPFAWLVPLAMPIHMICSALDTLPHPAAGSWWIIPRNLIAIGALSFFNAKSPDQQRVWSIALRLLDSAVDARVKADAAAKAAPPKT